MPAFRMPSTWRATRWEKKSCPAYSRKARGVTFSLPCFARRLGKRSAWLDAVRGGFARMPADGRRGGIRQRKATHGPVCLEPHQRIGRAPYLAAVVEARNPDQIMFWSIVDDREGITFSLALDIDGKRWIELNKGHEETPAQRAGNNAAAATGFRPLPPP